MAIMYDDKKSYLCNFKYIPLFGLHNVTESEGLGECIRTFQFVMEKRSDSMF